MCWVSEWQRCLMAIKPQASAQLTLMHQDCQVVYKYRLRAGNKVITRKMTLIK